MPVKEYAAKNKISLSAAYKRINSNKVKTKKIGSYTLVAA